MATLDARTKLFFKTTAGWNTFIADATNKAAVDNVNNGYLCFLKETSQIYAYGTYFGISSADFATLSGAVNTLNADSGTTGSVAKAVADAKTALIGGATDNGNTLKKLEDRIDAVDGKTVTVNHKTGNTHVTVTGGTPDESGNVTYTVVESDIASATALTAVDNAVKTLNGEATTAGSVKKAVADAKSEILGNVSESANTLAKLEELVNAATTAAGKHSIVAGPATGLVTVTSSTADGQTTYTVTVSDQIASKTDLGNIHYFSKVSDGTNEGEAATSASTLSLQGSGATTVKVGNDGVTVYSPVISESTTNGSIKVGTTDVAVHGLEDLAYTKKDDLLKDTALSGTPTAPNMTEGSGEGQIANKKYVDDSINEVLSASSAMVFKGEVGGAKALPTTGVSIGDTYVVSVAGTYAGQTCEVGDMLISKASGTTTDASWIVVQANIDGAVTTTGTSHTANAVAIFDGTTGKAIKSSDLTIETSVPANALFTDTTYTFADGTNGTFTVTPKDGTAQTVSVGKPSTAETADKVANKLTVNTYAATSAATGTATEYDGSAAKTVDAAAKEHTHESDEVTALTGYQAIAANGAVSALAATDSLNTALAKLEAMNRWNVFD